MLAGPGHVPFGKNLRRRSRGSRVWPAVSWSGVLLDQGADLGQGGDDVLGGVAADGLVGLDDGGAGRVSGPGVGDGEQGLGHLVAALGEVVAEVGAAGRVEVGP